MNKPTLKALKESITAWELKYELAKKEQYGDIICGWRVCPLCQRFLRSECKRCPVKVAGWSNCEGTAYNDVMAILNSINECGVLAKHYHETLLELMEVEIIFLKSLLPKEEM